MTEGRGLLIVASSEADSNLYYACRFLAPDPFVYVDTGERRRLLMTDLEIDRARAQARVDEVLSWAAYESKARQRWSRPHPADVVALLLEDLGLGAVGVPASFPLEYADRLRERGIGVTARPDPLFPERLRKSPEEVAAIGATQRHTEAALQAALTALGESEIRDDLVYRNGRPLTAEDLKKIVKVALMENDCVAQHTIIACGADGADPHYEGCGPIRPHQSIVFDIFPRSSSSRYFADMTRTVVKGRASDTRARRGGSTSTSRRGSARWTGVWRPVRW